MERKIAWEKYSQEEMDKVFTFAEDYRQFLSHGKTERECVKLAVAEAKAHGYEDLNDVIAAGKTLKAGDKVYSVCMGKTLAMFQIGEEPLENGMNIVGAHIDSPRIDLKQNPLYEDNDMAMFDTHYYGGIKKYQWVALPHLAREQMAKTAAKIIEGEDLNLLIGSIPVKGEEKEAVKKNILAILKEKYDIEEDDFISAELEVVPAGAARDYGFDRSMIMGYGHDDRVCAYPSYKAMFELGSVKRTAVCLLVDKEEIGSVGATGMTSFYFENTVAEVINACGDYSDIKVRRALNNSRMLSSDVSAGFDPNYPSVMEKNNSAFLGKGLTFNTYTGSGGKSGSNDANAEYVALVRKIMDDADVTWQTAELGKVDVGGGGTIAYLMAKYGMNVIDSGVPVLSMHAPWEIISKADLYEALKGYIAFLNA